MSLLEFIEAEEKRLRDWLAYLGRVKAALRRGETVETVETSELVVGSGWLPTTHYQLPTNPN